MIDVIIPIYNSGHTIGRTLNSILEQDISKDLCVYIVDDCGEETYSNIIKHYSKYLNITFLRLDKNVGPGVARQYALDNSSNEYIVFIDSDDEFYDKYSVSKLYRTIESCEVVFGQMEDIYNDGSSVGHNECCLHGKMYRRSFLERNNIKFNNLRSHEDNAFNQLCLICAKSVIYLDDIIYRYNNTKDSITNTEDDIKSYKTYIKSMDWLFKEVEKRENTIDKKYTGSVITEIMMYLYYNYLLNEEGLSFCFEELSFLKEMYNKYSKYIDYSDLLRIYKNFDYPVVPTITLYDFIKKIKKES